MKVGDNMIYPSDIPYMKTVSRKVMLNPGHPINRGNLVFLMSKDPKQSILMMDQKENCYPNGHYYYYFYKPRFYLRIRNKNYRINELDKQDDIYGDVEQGSPMHGYPKKLAIRENEFRNTYYELSKYMEIFYKATKKLTVFKKVEVFWNLLKPVLTDSYGELHNKVMIMDANMFPFSIRGQLVERVNNPAYMLYFTLYRNFDLIKDLDLDILIYCKNRILKINPSKCDEKSHIKCLMELRRLYAIMTIPEVTKEELVAADNAEGTSEDNTSVETQNIPPSIIKPKNAIKGISTKELKISHASPKVKSIVSAIGDDKVLAEKIEKKCVEAAEKAKESDENTENKSQQELADEAINEDKELIEEIYNKMISEKPQASQKSTARDQMLREKQKDLVVNGMTVEQLSKIKPKETKIEEEDIHTATNTTNPNMKKIKFQNFNKSYVDKVMNKDIVNVFQRLNDKSIKMFILDMDVKDTSDVLNYKETWTVHLEDENRQRHTIKFDIPKFYDKNFIWIGGNTKTIKNQNFFLPVVKISNDTVMIVTNYNKMSIQRVDSRTLRELTLIEKSLTNSPELQKFFTAGSASVENRSYVTLLEYDEYAKKFTQFKCKSVHLIFSQKTAQEYAKSKEIKIPKDHIFVGMDGSSPIFIDINTQRTKDGKGISDIILDAIPEDMKKSITSLNIPKRLMYTKVTTMKQDCPIAVLMCLWEGLTTVLKKANIKFRLENSTRDIKPNEDYMRFKNCYLIYDTDVPTELLMNGLKVLDTKSYNISEMDTQTPYIPYIEKKYGKISILNALNNVYEFTIGGIEEEILTDLHLPTDLISLMVYANSLLADNQFVSELNQSEYRVRCAEVIPAILYDSIAKAYVPFKNSNGKKKLSIPQDAVIKKLLALTTVEDYSSLNPFLELETTHGISTKGWRGVNLEESYTVPKRSYDDSMVGVIGVSSPPDGQVGVNRCLTMEPNINSVRGYVDVKSDKLDEIKDVNLFSPAELLIPLGATRDDPLRTGHSVKQSRASIPIKNSSPVLMSNGSDEICKYYLSSDFVVNAEQDGTVVELDPKSMIMIVEYKDGSHRAVNLNKNIVKNGGGGFELSNVLITDLKVGDKFKANDTLAWHKDFFKKIPGQGVRMCVGALIKVAIYSSYNTYEDANFITEEVAHMCETEMCFRHSASIGKNSNVFSMVKIGDEVAVGDPLIQFDESFEESDINKLLDSLGDDEELKEAVTANNKNRVKAKCSGTIEDIKIYAASDLEELSPTLQTIVGNYYKKIDKKRNLLNKYDKTDSTVKCGLMIKESSGKTEPDRYGNIRGVKVHDGVLIEFYIKHAEPLEVGSKVANFSPLKNIVSEVLPKGYEPVSEFRPNETVGSTISPSSILNRMVSSVLPTIFGNKCIVELKRSLQVIWLSQKDFSVKRKEMTDLIYRFFNAMDKTGDNTKKYKAMFEPMSETKFKSFFKEFFENEYHYLILDIVDYERTVMIEDIERAAKVLNIPLFEKVSFPHYTMDKEHPIVTKQPIAVGYLHLKRPQQTVMKKNGMSTGADTRSAFTGQVTGADKNGRESDLENSVLTSLGMNLTLKELNGPRADDLVMKREMLQNISSKGYLQLSELTDEVENKTTLNTVNTYFLGMGLKTDLVSKGLRLPYVTKKE